MLKGKSDVCLGQAWAADIKQRQSGHRHRGHYIGSATENGSVRYATLPAKNGFYQGRDYLLFAESFRHEIAIANCGARISFRALPLDVLKRILGIPMNRSPGSYID